MASQKVVNNPLGSYPVSVDRAADGSQRQAVGLDFGDVTGDVWTPSRVSRTNPFPVTTSTAGSSTSIRSNKTASLTSQLLISVSTTRVEFIILNDSTATLTICYDAAASSTAKTAIIPPGQHYTDNHGGEVYGLWDVATGDARITEKF